VGNPGSEHFDLRTVAVGATMLALGIGLSAAVMLDARDPKPKDADAPVQTFLYIPLYPMGRYLRAALLGVWFGIIFIAAGTLVIYAGFHSP
jgi:hypothetical protein